MPAGTRIARRRQLDDAAQLSTELSGIGGSADFHRLVFIDAEGLCESRRPIVVKRDSIDDVLDSILEPTRMQDAIRFEQPPRLCVYHLDDRPSGGRTLPMIDRLRSQVSGGAGALLVSQGIGGFSHCDFGLDGCDREDQFLLDGRQRANLDKCGDR